MKKLKRSQIRHSFLTNKVFLEEFELAKRQGAKQELELVEDTLLGIIMLESEPAKIITEFRVWLQERKGTK